METQRKVIFDRDESGGKGCSGRLEADVPEERVKSCARDRGKELLDVRTHDPLRTDVDLRVCSDRAAPDLPVRSLVWEAGKQVAKEII